MLLYIYIYGYVKSNFVQNGVFRGHEDTFFYTLI